MRSGRDRSLVLLVECNAAISLALADELEGSGYEVAGPLGAWSDALRWLESNSPDLVVLEAMLRDGFCIELAQALKHRGIPFLVYSGHSRLKNEPAFEGVPWVQKPALFSEIAQGLRSLRPGRDRMPLTISTAALQSRPW